MVQRQTETGGLTGKRMVQRTRNGSKDKKGELGIFTKDRSIPFVCPPPH